mgnify:CR=1 FL=1
MRQICLDTETTGKECDKGDRIVEIGCVEIVGRNLLLDESHYYHVYINPERDVPEEVVKIHGLDNRFLADKPVFAAIVERFIEFITGADLIIHNAEFDIGFLNAEFARLGKGRVEDYCHEVIDSLAIARGIYPGLRNTLDALCNRYEIDRSERTLHGALLDARLLAEVYLSMTREQGSIRGLTWGEDDEPDPLPPPDAFIKATTPPEDLKAHEEFLERIAKKSKNGCLWLNLREKNNKTPEN